MPGCIKLPKKSYPQRRLFVLSVERSGVPGERRVQGALGVGKIRISPRYGGSEFVYRKGKFEYKSDYYNSFFVTPAANFKDEITRWMTASGLFVNVVRSGSQVEAEYVLETGVPSFYGDYRKQDRCRAVLNMQFLLLHLNKGSTEIVFKKDYRKEITINKKAPDLLVAGWSEALKQILAELERDLRKKVLQMATENSE